MELDPERATNLANWNDRVPIHVGPTSNYETHRYVSEPHRISSVVEIDRQRLGDLHDRSLLHLQCHIGTDTLSLARLGARVTGIDFSAPAIAACRELFEATGTPGRFVESELYDTPTALPGETFDLVYTSIGAINWLPDMTAWAEVVAAMLAPGGRLVVRDAHPALAVIDHTRDDDLLLPHLPYFGSVASTWDQDIGTYADPNSKLDHITTVEWVHSLSSIVNAVIGAGMRLDRLDEFDTIDWKALDSMVEVRPNQWALPDHQHHHLPLSFAIEATRLPAT